MSGSWGFIIIVINKSNNYQELPFLFLPREGGGATPAPLALCPPSVGDGCVQGCARTCTHLLSPVHTHSTAGTGDVVSDPSFVRSLLKKISYYNNNMNFSFHFVSPGKVSIVREVLHKEDFRVAESGLLQRGRVGPLLCGEAGQDAAREVGLNLELLRAFLQGEQEVVDHLGKKHRDNCQLGEQRHSWTASVAPRGGKATKSAPSLPCRHETAIFSAWMEPDLSQRAWQVQKLFLALPAPQFNREQQKSRLCRR